MREDSIRIRGSVNYIPDTVQLYIFIQSSTAGPTVGCVGKDNISSEFRFEGIMGPTFVGQ